MTSLRHAALLLAVQSIDGLIGMAASGWISLHKNIHKIQNINTKQKYKNISLQSEQYE